jgi:hypothetical protein
MIRIHTLLLAAVAARLRRRRIRNAEASAPDSATLARRAEADRAHQDSIVRARPGYIIDSILPVEQEIRRFQATIPVRLTAFSNAARSRSGLVKQFVRSLERNDTTALRRLVVDRAEFGYLVYPTSPNAAPPLPPIPDLVWLSRWPAPIGATAASRLLDRFGGSPLGYAGFTCPESADRQRGKHDVSAPCIVTRVASSGDTTRLRMFGAIVGRDGRSSSCR